MKSIRNGVKAGGAALSTVVVAAALSGVAVVSAGPASAGCRDLPEHYPVPEWVLDLGFGSDCPPELHPGQEFVRGHVSENPITATVPDNIPSQITELPGEGAITAQIPANMPLPPAQVPDPCAGIAFDPACPR